PTDDVWCTTGSEDDPSDLNALNCQLDQVKELVKQSSLRRLSDLTVVRVPSEGEGAYAFEPNVPGFVTTSRIFGPLTPTTFAGIPEAPPLEGPPISTPFSSLSIPEAPPLTPTSPATPTTPTTPTTPDILAATRRRGIECPTGFVSDER